MAANISSSAETVSDVPAVLSSLRLWMESIHFMAEPGLLGDGRNIFHGGRRQRRGRRGRGRNCRAESNKTARAQPPHRAVAEKGRRRAFRGVDVPVEIEHRLLRQWNRRSQKKPPDAGSGASPPESVASFRSARSVAKSTFFHRPRVADTVLEHS